MWWQKRNKLFVVIVISAITGAFSTYYLTRAGSESAVFLLDPDVVYTANAISYISSGLIHYVDHPGTPTIRLLAFFLWPLRIYLKLFAQTTFVTWSFIHYSFVLVYLRLFQSVLLSTAVFIYVYSVLKITKSLISAIFTWLAIIVYSPVLYFGSAIVPETTSFFIISAFLFLFAYYRQNKPLFLMLLLPLISGILIGNKFTNLFLVAFSCSLPLLNVKYSFPKRAFLTLISSFLALCGFLIATWPIHNQYFALFSWSLRLASFSEIHGGGKNTFFDMPLYLDSIKTLINREFAAGYIITFGVISAIFVSALKRKLVPEFVSLLFSGIAGTLLFSKYPLSHYQLANYLMIIFSISYYFSYLPRIVKVLPVSLLLALAVTSFIQYGSSLNRTLSWAKNLSSYVMQNPPQKADMWQIGEAVDFARLWSRVWAGGLFTNELAKRPDLIDYSLIEEQNLFKECWDRFYTRTTLAQQFIARFPDRQFKYIPIPNTNGSASIESDHCLTKP